MTALLVAVVLAQDPACRPDAVALMAAAAQRADAFDLEGAADRLATAWAASCADAEVAAHYVRAWIDAREAYRAGGSPESLRPVVAAMSVLKIRSEIAFYVLQAAAAAAQSERDAMALFLDQAVQLEGVRLAAGLRGAPIITAHEAAGDLWLQVHRYDDARRAYQLAGQRLGMTRHVTLGLARTAARLKDAPEACRQYRTLVASWNEPGTEPQEIDEARAFLRTSGCPSLGR